MPKLASKKPAILKKQIAPAFEVGDVVSYKDDENDITGKINSISGKVAEVEDDDGNQYDLPIKELVAADTEEEEEEEEEEEKPKKKVISSKKKEEEEEEEEEEEKSKKKKGGKGKGSSFASIFNQAEPAKVGGGLPVGEWQALVTDAGVEINDRGISAWFEFTGTNEDEEEVYGKKAKKTFFLTDEGEATTSLEYFLSDLATLGKEDIQIEGDDDEEAADNLNDHLQEIVKECPWVEIKVVPQKNNPVYNNIWVQSLCEDQDEKPDIDSIPAED